MATDPDALNRLAARVDAMELGPEAELLGRVAAIADGLAEVTGLPDAVLGEVLEFDGGARGFVLNLEEERVQVALLDPDEGISAGSPVRCSGTVVSVPVGDELLGRVIDPLGRPLDDGPPLSGATLLPVERPAPAIIERDFVSEPLQTGILVIDSLFAIGRGQRELIIGERATGKTAIAVDTMINQAGGDMVCVYVAIGQRATAVARVIAAVKARGAMARSVFVVAPATAPPGLRWLAPFAGTTIAEAVRDAGGHALVVHDDLTKHATTHRELALLARQPPGREAYPGDIFYLHARLLERAAKLSPARGGGSLSALPIAEIEAGNLSAYIPTNLISISDGQIVLSSTLFASGQRPAVDVGLSVSRVGGKAQVAALKAVAGRVRLDYAQYLELRMFARFGGFGDAQMKARIAHGDRIGALLTQVRYAPLRVIDQVALLSALAEGHFDAVALEAIPRVKAALPAIIDAEPALAAFDPAAKSQTPAVQAALLACVTHAIAAAAGPAP
ncbi:MAG: F0F1 ATP synthase subunit alpha [Limimaricola sp.]|uniref:F0F1 ATP synthase subunit alpha n=1 Tax=Limimaricola sp. TaxID=2211665 RepID=UPI001D2E769E|nr:F0F1 ATP synthase subunit alpha [Limimaricola sp.]MBI1418209.1 F0F1 ATP synthase subunit alpha [Limimaricola sp.]